MKLSRVACLPLAVLSLLAIGACGDSESNPPTGVVPTPTPAPSATPTPAPTPTPVGTCTLAAMPDCGALGCCREGGTPLFDAEIIGAQAAVREAHPDWFRPNGTLRVDDVTYTEGVAQKLTEIYSLCARGGDTRNPNAGGHSISSDEVAIKRDNGTSQNVDIIIGSTGTPSIIEHFTCRPASF